MNNLKITLELLFNNLLAFALSVVSFALIGFSEPAGLGLPGKNSDYILLQYIVIFILIALFFFWKKPSFGIAKNALYYFLSAIFPIVVIVYFSQFLSGVWQFVSLLVPILFCALSSILLDKIKKAS